jgi:hypothetical protein
MLGDINNIKESKQKVPSRDIIIKHNCKLAKIIKFIAT